MTEDKAIAGCKKQDRISQKYLFDTYADGMLMVCMRYVKNLQDAEELMLNGFTNFFKSIDRFVYNGPGSTGGWLKKIMVNECLMFLRKRKELKIADESLGTEVSADNGQWEKMNAADIFQLILTLPAGYRAVFNLFAIEGYSHKEIAEMLDIKEGTSKSQLSKARLMLQKGIMEKRTVL